VAQAPGHQFGQIIGNAVEQSVEPILRRIADQHGLYLDKKGPRSTRGQRRKVIWTDGLGNRHDLDFVLERAGTEAELGKPAAFIETAWRRYTKQSRNKAQEIQGAVLPLLIQHSDIKPFAGAVLAGRWTVGALNQMRSNGFVVVHISYEEIVAAFGEFGIEARDSPNPRTSDEYYSAQVHAYHRLSAAEVKSLSKRLSELASDEYERFEATLQESLTRKVIRVVVLPLSGSAMEFDSPQAAIEAIEDFDQSSYCTRSFVRFEIQMTYSNGDTITATFAEKQYAIDFMQTFL
jgi:hypothetical protein